MIVFNFLNQPSRLDDRAASVMRRTVRKGERPRPTSWYVKGEERPEKPKVSEQTSMAMTDTSPFLAAG